MGFFNVLFDAFPNIEIYGDNCGNYCDFRIPSIDGIHHITIFNLSNVDVVGIACGLKLSQFENVLDRLRRGESVSSISKTFNY